MTVKKMIEVHCNATGECTTKATRREYLNVRFGHCEWVFSVMNKHFIPGSLPPAKRTIIYVSRDPRDTTISLAFWFGIGKELKGNALKENIQAFFMAWYPSVLGGMAEGYAASLRARYLMLRYEEMHEDIRWEIKRLASHLNLWSFLEREDLVEMVAKNVSFNATREQEMSKEGVIGRNPLKNDPALFHLIQNISQTGDKAKIEELLGLSQAKARKGDVGEHEDWLSSSIIQASNVLMMDTCPPEFWTFYLLPPSLRNMFIPVQEDEAYLAAPYQGSKLYPGSISQRLMTHDEPGQHPYGNFDTRLVNGGAPNRDAEKSYDKSNTINTGSKKSSKKKSEEEKKKDKAKKEKDDKQYPDRISDEDREKLQSAWEQIEAQRKQQQTSEQQNITTTNDNSDALQCSAPKT